LRSCGTSRDLGEFRLRQLVVPHGTGTRNSSSLEIQADQLTGTFRHGAAAALSAGLVPEPVPGVQVDVCMARLGQVFGGAVTTDDGVSRSKSLPSARGG